MSPGGRLGSDSAGTSSDKRGKNPRRRKSKVSWGRLIHPGLVDPKLRPYGVSDGQSVNIRILPKLRYQFLRDVMGIVLRSVGCLRSRQSNLLRGPQALRGGRVLIPVTKKSVKMSGLGTRTTTRHR